MRSRFILLLIVLVSLSLCADDISFSGGYSRAMMNKGRKELLLSENANVSVGSLSIDASSISLSGRDYESVTCSGNVRVADPDEGFSMKTQKLFFDRQQNRLLITSWCEISDTKNELEASAASLSYDIDSKELLLEMRVRLIAITEDGILSGSAESASYNRESNVLILSGGATVNWKGDTYKAQLITVDIEKSEIHLDGRIEGTIHG
ncbi:MAG: hypothetical protein IJ831_01500 [Spirochaetales bacterium]|nr:hypothetical protein [Spirochaetales bacterium]